ncbi:hypothetical protein CapIbe_016752 [Capra ibex]
MFQRLPFNYLGRGSSLTLWLRELLDTCAQTVFGNPEKTMPGGTQQCDGTFVANELRPHPFQGLSLRAQLVPEASWAFLAAARQATHLQYVVDMMSSGESVHEASSSSAGKWAVGLESVKLCFLFCEVLWIRCRLVRSVESFF